MRAALVLDRHDWHQAVIPALVAGIHLSTRSGVRGWLDTGDKPRYDTRVFAVARN